MQAQAVPTSPSSVQTTISAGITSEMLMPSSPSFKSEASPRMKNVRFELPSHSRPLSQTSLGPNDVQALKRIAKGSMWLAVAEDLFYAAEMCMNKEESSQILQDSALLTRTKDELRRMVNPPQQAAKRFKNDCRSLYNVVFLLSTRILPRRGQSGDSDASSEYSDSFPMMGTSACIFPPQGPTEPLPPAPPPRPMEAGYLPPDFTGSIMPQRANFTRMHIQPGQIVNMPEHTQGPEPGVVYSFNPATSSVQHLVHTQGDRASPHIPPPQSPRITPPQSPRTRSILRRSSTMPPIEAIPEADPEMYDAPSTAPTAGSRTDSGPSSSQPSRANTEVDSVMHDTRSAAATAGSGAESVVYDERSTAANAGSGADSAPSPSQPSRAPTTDTLPSAPSRSTTGSSDAPSSEPARLVASPEPFTHYDAAGIEDGPPLPTGAPAPVFYSSALPMYATLPGPHGQLFLVHVAGVLPPPWQPRPPERRVSYVGLAIPPQVKRDPLAEKVRRAGRRVGKALGRFGRKRREGEATSVGRDGTPEFEY